MKQTSTRKGEVERLVRLAHRLDEAAFRLARGRPAIDVALGEIFLRLSVGNRLIDLNCSKKVDFANEKLGLPPGEFLALSKLAAGLRDRPLLRQAVIAGEVTPVKARSVMARAVGEGEAPLVAAAMEMTVKELKKFTGADESEPEVAYRLLKYGMSAEQQDRLDAALSLAREMVGYGARLWKQMEAVSREWLGSWKHLGGAEPEEGESGTDPDWLKEMTRKSDAVSKQLQAVFEASEVLEASREEAEGDTPLGLLAQARRLLARRKKFDEPLGRVLARISQLELWRWLKPAFLTSFTVSAGASSPRTASSRLHQPIEGWLAVWPGPRRRLSSRNKVPLRIRASGWPQVNQLAIRERTECESGEKGRLGCESFGDYCLERLGFSESTAKQRVRLEKRLRELPQLRQALLSGRITYTKALVVARSATPADVAEKIAASAETTWQQVDREAREEEDRADRAASRRKIHGPRVAMRLVEDAVESARQFFASRGEPIDAGEALARVADHFVARYEVPLRRAEWRRKWEKDVLLRQGGLCVLTAARGAGLHPGGGTRPSHRISVTRRAGCAVELSRRVRPSSLLGDPPGSADGAGSGRRVPDLESQRFRAGPVRGVRDVRDG